MKVTDLKAEQRVRVSGYLPAGDWKGIRVATMATVVEAQAGKTPLLRLDDVSGDGFVHARVPLAMIAPNTIERADLSFTYNRDGYMLTYKGKPIGGAGVMLPRKGRRSQADLVMYREQAQRDLDAIAAGAGDSRFLKAIAEIDAD